MNIPYMLQFVKFAVVCAVFSRIWCAWVNCYYWFWSKITSNGKIPALNTMSSKSENCDFYLIECFCICINWIYIANKDNWANILCVIEQSTPFKQNFDILCNAMMKKLPNQIDFWNIIFCCAKWTGTKFKIWTEVNGWNSSLQSSFPKIEQIFKWFVKHWRTDTF